MNTNTRASLLLRVRNHDDQEAWREFHGLYGPLLYAYARRRGLSHEDAEDVRSTCWEILVRSMKDFHYDESKGGFKAWLRTLVTRRVVDRLRKRRERLAQSAELESLPDASLPVEDQWEEVWMCQHVAYCLEKIRTRVSSQTFELFDLLTRERLSVAEICRRHGVSANQVYKAKARVIEMIRQEMRYLDPEMTT